MDKQAAINAMRQGGYKVSHVLFDSSEWIAYCDKEYYIDEQGHYLNIDEFWKNRQCKEWETGWSIIG
jgi:hypothetical protein